MQEASDIINGVNKSKSKYGSFETNFKDAAKVASILTNKQITPKDVNACLIGLKIARLRKGHHYDSFLDLIAYIASMEVLNK